MIKQTSQMVIDVDQFDQLMVDASAALIHHLCNHAILRSWHWPKRWSREQRALYCLAYRCWQQGKALSQLRQGDAAWVEESIGRDELRDMRTGFLNFVDTWLNGDRGKIARILEEIRATITVRSSGWLQVYSRPCRQAMHLGLLIPRDPNYPDDSVQCDDCGGTGYGDGVMTSQPQDCQTCHGRGWCYGITHPKGRRCENDECCKPLQPNNVAVYCSNDCAIADI